MANRVVKDLLDGYQGLGHHLYVDNFYTSPKLFKDLLETGTLACGTVQSNRRGFPPELKTNIKLKTTSHVKSLEKNRQKVEILVPHLHIYINYANFGRCHGDMN